MKKIYAKFIVIALQLVLAISVVMMSSYAWMVLSNNPVAEGIQITIGGGNTILIAADLTEEVDGTVYHYPDVFRETLNFSQHKSYEYLNNLGELTPVSTADGLNWFLPTYYDLNDQEVKDGTALAGTLKSIDRFILDDSLKYANLTTEDAQLAEQGSYIYLDFWVVSPGEDYTLRVSTDEDSGSYVIGLPRAENSENGYTLADGESNAATCVRVGLLANPDEIRDNTMVYYQNNYSFSEQYTRLRGAYREPGSSANVYSSGYRFMIYEPNGDTHISGEADPGAYLITDPIGLVDGSAQLVDIRDRLTVQKTNTWAVADIGAGTMIEQRFQTAIREPDFDGLSEEEITHKFYEEYLGAQVAPYVTNGFFVKNTQNLYDIANEAGSVSGEFLGEEYIAGATDDVYIVKLEKNVPQRIRLFVWLEGEDADCINSAAASSFALRMELAGSNKEQ